MFDFSKNILFIFCFGMECCWKNPCEVFNPRRQRLQQEFGKLLGPRTWPAVSEVQLARSAAGWAWLRCHSERGLKHQHVRLDVAWDIAK